MKEKQLNNVAKAIQEGTTSLGIEFGSTRIKAVLIGPDLRPLASGGYDWENEFQNGYWTYSLQAIWTGLQEAYADLLADVRNRYYTDLEEVASLGFSGMMHGYMAFDKEGNQLVPFRTWRNTTTQEASKILMETFNYPIPQRWTIAHFYQAVLNQEDHVEKVAYVTTLAGYIHWQLTGEKVIGVGDGSGMFPIDPETGQFDQTMLDSMNALLKKKQVNLDVKDILPQVLQAGEVAGQLKKERIKQIDRSVQLQPGIPICPPEGDAGTGMVATNSVAVKTGNVSFGTSAFGMVVLDKPLAKAHEEIDLVTTPHGKLVAMSHSNNGTSNLNAWIDLFQETLATMGKPVDKVDLYQALYTKALEGDPDAGGLLAYGYLSGEHITGFEAGRPLFVRSPENTFNLANFMRVNLYTSLGALKMGFDILMKEEQVEVEEILAHGGLFKTKGVGQQFLADALNTKTTVMETAGEGGAWGIALLAAYMQAGSDQSLEAFLNSQVFDQAKKETLEPVAANVEGFETFMASYKKGLKIERAAVDYQE